MRGTWRRPKKKIKKPLYEWGIVIAAIAGIFALSGQFVSSILPIWSADTGDFCINVRPIPIEAEIVKNSLITEDIEGWLRVSDEKCKEQAIVSVEDTNNYIKNYKYTVWLRSFQDCNVTVRFENPGLEPPFEAKMFVYVNDPTKSIEYAPITIQGVGGDGKKRNCTVYVAYRSPTDLVKEGGIEYNIGRLNKSIELLDKAIEINEEYAPAWKAKGFIYLTKYRNYQKAVEFFNRCVSYSQDDAEAFFLKGTALSKLGKHGDAVIAYDEAIRINSKYSLAWKNKGSSLCDLNKFEDAIKCYEEAIEINPNDATAWTYKGHALYNLFKYNDAILAFDEAIKIDPNYDLPWSLKGFVFDDQRKFSEAKEAFAQARQINPNCASTWNNESSALYNLTKYDENVKGADFGEPACIYM